MCEPTVQAAVRQFFAFTLRNVNKGCGKQRTKKMLLLLCAVVIGNVYVFARAQSVEDTKITIGCANQTLDQALQLLKNAANVNVYYMTNDVQPYQSVTLEKKTRTVKETLQLLLSNTSLSYRVDGNKIMVTNNRKPALVESSLPMADTVTLRGRVINEEGKPLEGVAVQVKNTIKGTITNSNGEFGIRAGGFSATLLFSFLGYAKTEYYVNGNSIVTITLKDDDLLTLNNVEVYSTGYQSVPRERATGSFVELDKKILNRTTSTNILNRLYGVTSGLNFQPSNSSFSNRSDVVIRGVSTINSNPRPLIVIDGFPYDEAGTGNISQIVNNINPNDVESITVLKDAAAASIWGVRAGNGVIVITTKKGKYNQKTRITFTANTTIVQKPNLDYVPSLSSTEYVELERTLFDKGIYDSRITDINYPRLTDGIEILSRLRSHQIDSSTANNQLEVLKKSDIKKDIEKYLIRESLLQQYNLNMSGGSSNFSYYSSIGYDKNNIETVNNSYKRITARFDNIYKPIKQLEVGSYIVYTQSVSVNNGFNYSSFLPVGQGIAPYTRLAEDNGQHLAIQYGFRNSYVDTAKYPALLDWHYKPLDELALNNNSSKLFENRLGANLKYSFLNGFSLEFKYQYQKSNTSSNNVLDARSYAVRDLVNKFMYLNASGVIVSPIPNSSILNKNDGYLQTWNFRSQLSYNRNFSNVTVASIAGMETREVRVSSTQVRLYGYDGAKGTLNTNIDYNTQYNTRPTNSLSRIPNPIGVTGSLNRYESYYANSAITFNKKYTISGSARLDGSNFFGIKANQRIVPLWSAGASYEISKEDFYRSKFIPFLKLRATYGFNGNTNNSANYYPIIQYNNPNSLSLINVPYATLTSPPNPELRWERIKVFNLGIDFSTVNNIISGTIEFYHKNAIDLIGPISVDPTSGISSFNGNKASIIANGIDFSVKSLNLNKSIRWTTDFIFSFTKDKVSSYDIPSTLATSYVFQNLTPVIGKPLYSLYSYKYAGLDPANGDPRGIISDTVESYAGYFGKVKISDLVYNGTQNPTFFGSIRNTFNYRY
jgi:TonB-linked SusC/RagA family outer membrane protein